MNNDTPNIVNITNFLRQIDPRHPERNLFDIFKREAEILLQYKMPATFLLQHDALLDPAYIDYINKNLSADLYEIGGWFEITQSLVQRAGLKWRGRFSWDWHCNVGFPVGYTPQERIALVDAYMADFKERFNYYPESVGSWFIDAVSLGYMHDKYDVVASCNCKDQFGTDGYTLWGGYWNQAYYPSRNNSFIPAQEPEAQIPIPVFRMLGSDPIYQYESDVSNNGQAVLTLEPICQECGGNPKWVRWFFNQLTTQPSLNFSYTQAGQENSFGWPNMREGYKDQIEYYNELRNAGKIRIETLKKSGIWFRENFAVTPPTAMVATDDWQNKNRTSSWYNCKNYRANLFTDGGLWRLRDIHKFDQNYKERYLSDTENTPAATYDALPVIDGFRWSETPCQAGLFLCDPDGNTLETKGQPRVDGIPHNKLRVIIELAEGGEFITTLQEDRIIFQGVNCCSWQLEMRCGSPQCQIDAADNKMNYQYQDYDYSIGIEQGEIERYANGYIIKPKTEQISILLGRI